MRHLLPRAPIFIERVLDDPSVIHELIQRGGRYPTVQRYLKNLTEMAALSDAGRSSDGRLLSASSPMIIAPWFRGDWALETPLIDGLEPLFQHRGFRSAASDMFESDLVEPFQVYLNLTTPMPRVDPGHIDVPSFRGFDRRSEPVWLLVTMMKSGLFERYYIPTVTAVAWYYEGEAGGFRYYPAGPEGEPVDLACRSNTAIVGDNDRMFHAVDRVGRRGAPILGGLSLESSIALDGDRYIVRDGERTLAEFDMHEVRISVSWKARVFLSGEEKALFDEGRDLLTLEKVESTFMDALRERGIDTDPPEDLRTDERFMRILNDAFHVTPRRRRPQPMA